MEKFKKYICNHIVLGFYAFLVLLVSFSCTSDQEESVVKDLGKYIAAKHYDSGWEFSFDNYNGLGVATDGKVYYAIPSSSNIHGAQMFCFDPSSEKIEFVADLAEVVGEKGQDVLSQTEVNTSFYQYKNKLYFGTNTGHGEIINTNDSIEVFEYQGGHILSYDIETGEFEDLAIISGNEGVLVMNIDDVTGRLFGLTSPSGNIFRYDIDSMDFKELGSYSGEGELGEGENYYKLCRSLAVSPNDGGMFFANSTGALFRFDYGIDAIEHIFTDSLNKDYFGCESPHNNNSMGYQWRQTAYCPEDGLIYAVMNRSEYLLSLNPNDGTNNVIGRFSSDTAQKGGMLPTHDSSMGLSFAPDGHTLFFFSGTPGDNQEISFPLSNGKTSSTINCQSGYHLVSYDVISEEFSDHGQILFSDGNKPAHISSMAISDDGKIYALCIIKENGKSRTDLISIDSPL